MIKKKTITKKKQRRKVSAVSDIPLISPLPEKNVKAPPLSERAQKALDDIWSDQTQEESDPEEPLDLSEEEDEVEYDEEGNEINSKKEETLKSLKKSDKWMKSQMNTMFPLCDSYAKTLQKKAAYRKLFDVQANQNDTAEKKLAFAAFMAMPECRDIPQGQFSKFYNISEHTLSEWKTDPLIMKARNEVMEFHFKQFTPMVIDSLYRGTLTKNHKTGERNVQAIKLFMQIVEKWSEKTETDIKSDGKRIVLALGQSQFAKPGKIPQEETDDEQ